MTKQFKEVSRYLYNLFGGRKKKENRSGFGRLSKERKDKMDARHAELERRARI